MRAPYVSIVQSFGGTNGVASYASLMRIEHVVRVPNLEIDKLDPRGWVVLEGVQCEVKNVYSRCARICH